MKLTAIAQSVPPLINYQGKLVNSNGVPLATGDYELRFSIYDDPASGTALWGPQIFNGQTGPGFGPKIPVLQGYFNVILGPTDTNNLALPNALNGPVRFIEITIATNPPIKPRQQILSAPFSLLSGTSDRLQGSQWSDFFTTSNPATAKARDALVADIARNVPSLTTTQGLIFFVSTSGSDSNDGLDPGRPKQTVQAAVDAVPERIRHNVFIRISPGRYNENIIRIFNKRFFLGGFFQILNTTTNADNVVVVGLSVDFSTVYVQGVTFENPNSTAVAANDYSRLVLENCKFLSGQGLTIEEYSHVSIKGCIFEPQVSGTGFGVTLASSSLLTLASPSITEWDPTGILNNTFKNLLRGISIHQNSLVHGATPAFINVNPPYEEDTGGRHF